MPVWTAFQLNGMTIEKRVLLAHRLNTAYITYRLLSGEGTIRLKLRPSVHFRSHDAAVSATIAATSYSLTAVNELMRIVGGPPSDLRSCRFGCSTARTVPSRLRASVRETRMLYRTEANRGYDSTGELWSSGLLHVDAVAKSSASRNDRFDRDRGTTSRAALTPEGGAQEPRILKAAARGSLDRTGGVARRRLPFGRELVMAADQFVISARPWAVSRTPPAPRPPATTCAA